MSGVNAVHLVGRLGKDPEVRTVGESKVATFTMATSEVYKNKEGEKVENTEWHNIVLWKGLAGIAEQYLQKGSQVYIGGSIKTRSWDDKEGNKKYITEIIGKNLTMLGGKNESNNSSTTNESAPPPSEEDDLPF